MRNHPKTRNQKAAAQLPVHQRRVCPEMLEYKLKAAAEKKVLNKNARICYNVAMPLGARCAVLNNTVKNMEDQNDIITKENDELKEKNKELAEELKKLQHN